jgi:hypothetical protein
MRKPTPPANDALRIRHISQPQGLAPGSRINDAAVQLSRSHLQEQARILCLRAIGLKEVCDGQHRESPNSVAVDNGQRSLRSDYVTPNRTGMDERGGDLQGKVAPDHGRAQRTKG